MTEDAPREECEWQLGRCSQCGTETRILDGVCNDCCFDMKKGNGTPSSSQHDETIGDSAVKRSYCLPGKLVAAFDREAKRLGFVRERVVAAAILAFLESDPDSRMAMFDRLDEFLVEVADLDGLSGDENAPSTVEDRASRTKAHTTARKTVQEPRTQQSDHGPVEAHALLTAHRCSPSGGLLGRLWRRLWR
jgi:hypothetical protein